MKANEIRKLISENRKVKEKILDKEASEINIHFIGNPYLTIPKFN